MTTPTPHDDSASTPGMPNLFRQLAGIEDQVLREFQALCKGAQMQALMGGSARLADWFQTVALLIRDERNRRADKDTRIADPEARLHQHTTAMSERDQEAVAMGFARMLEKASPATRAALTPLIDRFYEPVRIELMQRLAGAELP